MSRKLTLTQALVEVDGLLWQQAHRFAARYGVEADDLYTFCRQVLSRKLDKWNPEKGKLTTFVWWVSQNELHDYCRRTVRQVPTDPAEFPETPDARPELRSLWGELKDALSWDSGEVVDVVVQMCDEGEFDGLLPYNRREARSRVMRRLRATGWGGDRAHAAFRELKQVMA